MQLAKGVQPVQPVLKDVRYMKNNEFFQHGFCTGCTGYLKLFNDFEFKEGIRSSFATRKVLEF